MKKLFLVGALALFSAVSAQEFKPTAGDVTVDLGVAGGLGNTTINLPDQGFGTGAMFKARYFKTENIAYRGTLFVGNINETDNSVPNFKEESHFYGFGLGFGMERHFTGTERLSPYVGGDVLLGYGNGNVKETNSITNIVDETKGPSIFRFGVRGVFGADYYIAKRVFLGVEAGLGLMYESEGDTTFKSTNNPDVVTKGGSSFRITPEVVTGIRVGFAF